MTYIFNSLRALLNFQWNFKHSKLAFDAFKELNALKSSRDKREDYLRAFCNNFRSRIEEKWNKSRARGKSLQGTPNLKSNSSVQFLSDQKVFRFYRFSADCAGKYAARGKRPFSIDRQDRKMFLRGASCGNRTLGAFNFQGKSSASATKACKLGIKLM